MSEIVAEHLKDRKQIKIYDPTSGSGSLLINIGRSAAKYISGDGKIDYYASGTEREYIQPDQDEFSHERNQACQYQCEKTEIRWRTTGLSLKRTRKRLLISL